MDTNRIKRFATEARNILKAGSAAKITTLGFDKNGNVAEENKPQLMQGGSLWNEQLQTEGFYYQWMSRYNRIQQKGNRAVSYPQYSLVPRQPDHQPVFRQHC